MSLPSCAVSGIEVNGPFLGKEQCIRNGAAECRPGRKSRPLVELSSGIFFRWRVQALKQTAIQKWNRPQIFAEHRPGQ